MSSESAREILAEVFGYSGFRYGQERAVSAVISGRDSVVLLPTGGGKSLCYQVPGIAFHRMGRGTTVVISPLIALMQDQVAALGGVGCAAAALNSHQSEEESREVVHRLLGGELALLYVSPERAVSPSFLRLLKRVEVPLLAVDEAHCVSQWGHDFRPEYMRLHEVRAHVSAPCIALTATATPVVLEEIETSLGLSEPERVCGDFSRPNLSFSVRHRRGHASRMEVLVQAIEDCELRGRTAQGRAIVYCATRKTAEKVAKELKSGGVPATHYHAGRTKLARERAQRSFELGKTKVLVATNAFGMGIDYPDVRLIVHFQAPGSLEAYYQEAGRAGRDGLPARCVLLFGESDLQTQRRLRESGGAAVRDRGEQALSESARLRLFERVPAGCSVWSLHRGGRL